MDLFFGGDFPDLYLGYGLAELIFMFCLGDWILLDGVLIIEDVELFLDIAQLRDGLVDLHDQIILDGLSLVTFLFNLL
jgi:hypothetical protein